MRIRTKRNKRGFTLVEMVTASSILSGAVLVLVAITTRSMTGTRLNRQYETAASIIEKQLSLLDYIGIDEFIELGRAEGVVEDFEPGYHWEATTEYQGIDSLYLVTITVTWMERNRPYSVSVQTRFNGMSTYVGAETEQE
ncbi:MAG: type IV pilus modification PilV family protein [Planctomycetota bacterium]|jgi:prepilin-type N-terminal cleavage/methylation domain-containing protein